jgi:hypothetical protein
MAGSSAPDTCTWELNTRSRAVLYVKEVTMLRIIWPLSLLLLGVVPASAQIVPWRENQQELTPQGAPSGGYSSGGTYRPSQPSPPSDGISCAKSPNPFYAAEIYVDPRASDAMCMPPPPRYDNPASAGPAKLNNYLTDPNSIVGLKPPPPPKSPKSPPPQADNPPMIPESTFDPAEASLTQPQPTQPLPQQYQYSPPQVTLRGSAQCQQAMSALLNGAPGQGSYERAIQLQNWYNANCL